MKPLLLLLTLLLPGMASAEFFQQRDKQLHMAGSAIGVHVLHAAGMTKQQAFWSMMFIGAMKELGDDNTGREHAMDMVANTIGAATIFTWRYEF